MESVYFLLYMYLFRLDITFRYYFDINSEYLISYDLTKFNKTDVHWHYRQR